LYAIKDEGAAHRYIYIKIRIRHKVFSKCFRLLLKKNQNLSSYLHPSNIALENILTHIAVFSRKIDQKPVNNPEFINNLRQLKNMGTYNQAVADSK